jgi:recombination protein RecA
MSQNVESAKKAALDISIAQIKKQFGEGAIMTLGHQFANKEIDVIPTGCLSLDVALGIGGVPRGRIVEVYGPESSGKSTLATHFAANAQKGGGIVAYIDAEHALDPKYAARIGVNIDQLLISQPDCGEEALNIAESLARSNAVDLIIIDSVAALVPKNELEGNIGDSFMGLQARMMSQALRKLTSTLAKGNTCAVFINQIREKIGIVFGNPETTTGGRALKFYSSIRLDIRRIGSIKGPNNLDIGSRVKVKVAKNKMAPPFRIAEFDILFNEGISRMGSILDLGVEHNIIDKKGTWFSYESTRLGQGREAAREELKKNPKLVEEIEKKILEKCMPKEKPKEETSEPSKKTNTEK